MCIARTCTRCGRVFSDIDIHGPCETSPFGGGDVLINAPTPGECPQRHPWAFGGNFGRREW